MKLHPAFTLLAIVAIAAPAAGHAARARLREKAADRELAAALAAVEPMAPVAGRRSVALNGSEVIVDRSTVPGPIDAVMARVAEDCASGDRDRAFGGEPRAEGASRSLTLSRIAVAEAASGARASLCIFAADGDADAVAEPRAPLARARYTLASTREDGTVAVLTVVNAAADPLARLFPAEGDAPGSDLPGVARPAASRRLLTAVVGQNEHSVRVYASTLPLDRAIASYDEAMGVLGYTTTGTLDDGRMFRKDGRSFVVSFEPTTTGATIAIVPFDGSTPSR